MTYLDYQLDLRLNQTIQNMGYTQPTPIQEQAIPKIMMGQDVAGLAQTGTGKTAAFLIPLIERILKSETEPHHERAFKDWQSYQCVLILVPTRELADQIHENVVKLTAGLGLKSFAFYGGTGYEKQKEALKNGLHFIVSTPGRLIDLYKEHFVDFKKVRAVVFDEADRMFDMGFKDDMKYVLSRIERNRQFLVFSATLNFDVLNTAYQFGAEPVEINISRDQATADHVKDAIYHLGNEEKPQHLISVMKKINPKQVIIFTNFKNNVDRLVHFLSENQIPAMGLSSLMNQTQRNSVIGKFKADNNQNVLVATDVAARGLDITGVDLVINYEMPQDCESYVHRIGRTGRAGNEGHAFSFVSDKDVESLYRIEEFTKKKIEIQYLEDADLVKDFKPMMQEEFSYKKGFDSNKSGYQKGGSSKGSRKEFADKKSDYKPGGGSANSTANNSAKKDKPHDKKDKQFKAKANGQAQQQSNKPNLKDSKYVPRPVPKHGSQKPAEVAKRVYRKSGSSSGGIVKKVAEFFKGIFG
jgi:ATP-dependent RNA helicase RhlE